MTVEELIAKLQTHDPDAIVDIYWGGNTPGGMFTLKPVESVEAQPERIRSVRFLSKGVWLK
jgi:hypothetical protein